MEKKYFNFDTLINRLKSEPTLYYKQYFHPRLNNHSTIFLANDRLLDQRACIKIIADFTEPSLVKIKVILPLPTIGFIVFYKDNVDENQLLNMIENLDISCLDIMLNIQSYREIINEEELVKEEDIQYFKFFSEQYSHYILKLGIDRALKNPLMDVS